MDKVYVILKNENERIQDLFRGKDIVSIDDLLNKLDELLDEISYLTKEED